MLVPRRRHLAWLPAIRDVSISPGRSTIQRVNPEIPIVLEPVPDPTDVTLDGIISAVVPWSYVPGLT
jgi:hypothetical protein